MTNWCAELIPPFPTPPLRRLTSLPQGDLEVAVRGKWVETVLYEIPLLVLVSECYFRFSDTDWNDDGQEERAYEKGIRLLSNGCVFSEFGTRRRRSYRTQEQILLGLMRAAKTFRPPPRRRRRRPAKPAVGAGARARARSRERRTCTLPTASA